MKRPFFYHIERGDRPLELFKLFGTIALDNTNANKGIDDTTDKAEKAQPKISKAFEKIGTAAVKAGKVIASGLAAGAVAIGKLVSGSVKSYAEYEQLVGGVETLFKTSADKVQEYAANAYKTAGMSANEYMETVTSFSASLLQSLGGDTAKAAEKADLAITDMADNANKMGTSMESIQNAYQGFAKQNYSMLDNLKLGYGGTAKEMYRLMETAASLDENFANSAVFSLDTKGHLEADYADIVDAIHIVQTQMGITGTTASEASTTIQGSILSMKAAWSNFATGMADDSQNFGVLTDNLINSILTVADNLVPRLQMLLPRLVEGLNSLITQLLPYIPPILEALLPGIIEGSIALMTGLVVMLPQILQILLTQVPNIVKQLADALILAFPVLLQTVKDLFGQIWDYIAVELLGTEADFESSFGKVKEFFEGLWVELQEIWNSVGQPIWNLIQDCIGIVRKAFAERMPEIREFVSGCFSDIKTFWNNNLKPCFEAIGNFIQTYLAPVFKAVFETGIKGTIDTVFGAIKNLWNNILKPVFTGITDFLTGAFTGNWEQAWNGIVNIFKGIINIIPTALEAVINGAISLVNGLISGINKISSKLGLGEIKLISKVSLPKLEKGGILEKGQVGLLEGNGAEAVVPLDQNQAWINAVAQDMQGAMGGAGAIKLLEQILEALLALDEGLVDKLMDAFAAMKFDVNNREFARMVKAVN